MKIYVQLNISLCLMLATLAAQAAETFTPQLGKLFLQPDKRVSLERQRLYNIRETENLESETLTVNGIVQRSGGKHTVWLNQKAQHENSKSTPLQVQLNRRAPAQASIQDGQESTTRLKVGEVHNRSTQEARDVVPQDALQTGKPSKR